MNRIKLTLVFSFLAFISVPKVSHAAEYLQKSFQCTIAASRQDAFSSRIYLPYRDQIEISTIREKNGNVFIASGYSYHPDLQSSSVLPKEFFDNLAENAAILVDSEQADASISPTFLTVALNSNLTFQLLHHLGERELRADDQIPGFTAVIHQTKPQFVQVHLQQNVRNGLSFHIEFTCNDILFNVKTIGRPELSSRPFVPDGTAGRMSLKDLPPPWAHSIKFKIDEKDYFLPVANNIQIPSLPIGKHWADLAYINERGEIGPVRRFWFLVEKFDAPKIIFDKADNRGCYSHVEVPYWASQLVVRETDGNHTVVTGTIDLPISDPFGVKLGRMTTITLMYQASNGLWTAPSNRAVCHPPGFGFLPNIIQITSEPHPD